METIHYRLIIMFIIGMSIFGCAYSNDSIVSVDSNGIESKICEVLKDDLFTERDAYDSCHYLMIPLRWAFKKGDKDTLAAFSGQFDRFLKYGYKSAEFQELSSLTKNHWYYLMAEYMCLAEENGLKYDSLLAENVIKHMMEYYNQYHGNWDAYKSYQNFYSLLDGLLFGEGYESGDLFNNVITDNDLFPLAILCDLKFLINNNSDITVQEEARSIINKSQFYVDEVVKKCIIWNGKGGWLFQPGVWDEHKDNAYNSYATLSDVNPSVPKSEKNVAWDTSHFQRFPIFLISFKRNAKNKQEYDDIQLGLAKQLEEFVIKDSMDGQYYLMTNYMDGKNGVYRYNPETGKGADAYEASGSLLLGWWVMLPGNYIEKVYEKTYIYFKDKKQVPLEYVDGITTRKRNPDFTSIEWYKLILECCCELL